MCPACTVCLFRVCLSGVSIICVHACMHKGLQEVSVCSAEEAMLILHLGLRHRHVAATKLNYNSSRGHAIFSIKLVTMVSFAEPTNAIISRSVVSL